MARSLDIETLIEDAFISLLPTYVQSGTTVIRWEDIKDKEETPLVKVAATLNDDEPGTVNCFIASNVLVDIAVFTSKRIDEQGRTGNTIRGQVRDLLKQSDVYDLLNTSAAGLKVYNNGVIPQTSSNDSDSKVWQKQITVLIVATTE